MLQPKKTKFRRQQKGRMTTKIERRIKIKYRVRNKISGTTGCPRMSVFRSNKQIYVQIIDDLCGKTLASASSLGLEEKLAKKEQAAKVGELIAKKAQEAGITTVVFDRNGYLYHEDPQVPNYGKRGYGTLLKKGLCIAIEPMITLGSREIVMERDGWTVRTRDRKAAAHFEHTIAVGPNGADILSTFDYVEQVLGDKAI